MKRAREEKVRVRPLALDEEMAVDVIAPAPLNQVYGLLFHIEEEYERRQLDAYHLQFECISARWFDQTAAAEDVPVVRRGVDAGMFHLDLVITPEVFAIIFKGLDAERLLERESLLELFFTGDPNALSAQVTVWLPSTANPATIGDRVEYWLLCGVQTIRHWRIRSRLREFWRER